jgi:hypothetical protein
MTDYLSKLPVSYRKQLLNVSKKNKTFEKFLNISRKNNINLFDKNKEKYTVKSKEVIEKYIAELKQKYVKAYGVNVVKNISGEDDVIESLKKSLNKLETKIKEIELFIFLLNVLCDNNLYYKYLLLKPKNKNKYKTKITYTDKTQTEKSVMSNINYVDDVKHKKSSSSPNSKRVSKMNNDIINLFVSSDYSDIADTSSKNINLELNDGGYIEEYSNN